MDIDDQFFHVTCHIDEPIKVKIERGDFVELDRLLPKTHNVRSENKLDLVLHDGQSFFVPVQSESKINGVRKWEQAFRIYAAIYSQANPMRAAEIWQYVHVINTAASAYIWENVSNYDVTFRHLMAANPQWSWAKIYNQMWNIAMREPIPKQSGNFKQGYSNSSAANMSQGQSGGQKQFKKRPNYCWTFNKGNCKDGQKCRFINRCSYCDSPDHGIYICPKAKKAGVTLATPQGKN